MMTAAELTELDALRARCAELEARLAATRDDADPATSANAGAGPGRNALFAAIQSTRMPMILTDPRRPDNPIIFANRAFVELSGYPVEELVGHNCRFLQGVDTTPEAVAKISQAIATRTTIAIDVANYSKDGRRFINELYISPVFEPNGDLLYFFGSQVDITAYTDARLNLQLALIERERHVLGQIAQGIPLARVLEDLLRVVEAQSDHGMRTSILLLSEDGRHLRHGAAPNLPAAYNEAIDGIAIGEGVGSCGTVASRGAAVYVTDIASDPLWMNFRDLALAHQLRACWSTPIKAADDSVLGTFAIYYDACRSPTQDEIAAIGFVTQTVALAIERHRHDRRLEISETQLQSLNAVLRTANIGLHERVATSTKDIERAWRLSQELLVTALPDGTFEAVNPMWTQLLGWEEHELVGASFEAITHPDDLSAATTALAGIMARPLVVPHECRSRHKDGSYRWFGWTAAFAGIAVGGSDGEFSVPNRSTSGSTTGGHIAFYDLAEFGPYYGASSTSASFYQNRTTRVVAGFGGLGTETERGSFFSDEFRSRLEFGRHFANLFGTGSATIVTPFVALELAELRTNGSASRPSPVARRASPADPGCSPSTCRGRARRTCRASSAHGSRA